MKDAVVRKRKMRSVHCSGKRVIITVVKLIALGSHSGVSHYDIGIIVQAQVHFVSGERTLVNCEFTIVVECIAGCVCASFLTLLRKYAKQIFTLLCIQSMIIIDQTKYCAHISRPPLP